MTYQLANNLPLLYWVGVAPLPDDGDADFEGSDGALPDLDSDEYRTWAATQAARHPNDRGVDTHFELVLEDAVRARDQAQHHIDALINLGSGYLGYSDRTLASLTGVTHPTIARRDRTAHLETITKALAEALETAARTIRSGHPDTETGFSTVRPKRTPSKAAYTIVDTRRWGHVPFSAGSVLFAGNPGSGTLMHTLVYAHHLLRGGKTVHVVTDDPTLAGLAALGFHVTTIDDLGDQVLADPAHNPFPDPDDTWVVFLNLTTKARDRDVIAGVRKKYAHVAAHTDDLTLTQIAWRGSGAAVFTEQWQVVVTPTDNPEPDDHTLTVATHGGRTVTTWAPTPPDAELIAAFNANPQTIDGE